MAYVTGTANTLADLLAAIQNACTTNGWTLSGNVLHKNTCYVELMISGTVITIRGGTGIDVNNNLTGATNVATCSLGIAAPSGFQITNPSNPPFTFPCSFDVHLHTAPDEVYVVVNYAVVFYQTIGFGQSATAGLAGSGNWYSGPKAGSFYAIGSGGEVVGDGTNATFAIFSSTTGGVHHNLDSSGWPQLGAARDWASLQWRQPNQWNGESILMPIRVYASRPSGFVSPVLECAHARFVNIGNLSDQQIITLGTDKWKVYPWWGRGLPGNGPGGTGGAAITYSGVCGHAFRYDGP